MGEILLRSVKYAKGRVKSRCGGGWISFHFSQSEKISQVRQHLSHICLRQNISRNASDLHTPADHIFFFHPLRFSGIAAGIFLLCMGKCDKLEKREIQEDFTYGTFPISGPGDSILSGPGAARLRRVPAAGYGSLAIHFRRRRGYGRIHRSHSPAGGYGGNACPGFSPAGHLLQHPGQLLPGFEKLWGWDCFVVPEYAFALRVTQSGITLSDEHTEYR